MAPNRRPTSAPLRRLDSGRAPARPLPTRPALRGCPPPPEDRKLKTENRPRPLTRKLVTCILLAATCISASTACPPPGIPDPSSAGFAAATPPAACDALGDPDERAVCESRRVEIDALADLATSSPDAAHRAAGLQALGQEPCFTLESACTALEPRLRDETDAATRRLVGPALACRCGPAAFNLIAEALRASTDPEDRLALIHAATDAITTGRSGETTEDDLVALADLLLALSQDESVAEEVRRAAAGALPVLAVPDATDHLLDHTTDPDAEARLQAQIAAGEGAALVPGLLQQLASNQPDERLKAIQGLTFLAAEVGTAQAAILEAALIGGEDPSPDVREAAGRLDPTMFLEGERDTLARVVAIHLARGELIGDAPAELAALPTQTLVVSRVRRHVLAAAAVLAAVVAGPAGDLGSMPDDDADPLAALDPLFASDDPELRLVALIAARRGLEGAATVRRPADPNPVVDAIERGQGDRLRVALTLAGRTIDPGDWESLLSSSAREALERPLDRSLADAFDHLSGWRIAGGDSTSERARLATLYERIFLRGFDDADRAFEDAHALAEAAKVSDLALAAERDTEVVFSCLAGIGIAWDAGFPRSLGEFQAFNRTAAGTECQDDDLILTTDDLRTACGRVSGEAAEIVGERCR